MTIEYPTAQQFQRNGPFRGGIHPEKPSRIEWCSAWLALGAGCAAVAFAAVAVSQPTQRHTVALTLAAPPPAYSPSEVTAAKDSACAAWDTAVDAMTKASDAVASTPPGWNNPKREQARSTETWVLLSQTAFLRSQVSPATPAELSHLIEQYNVLTLAQQDASVRRDGVAVDSLIDDQNLVVKRVDALCGS
ncbi:Uncharacterised protein [Mycobacteroides abscessus subsp. abscessus]|nr:Uncharacterised protein [Mycobacteroides abscessus subsp. abscessus]